MYLEGLLGFLRGFLSHPFGVSAVSSFQETLSRYFVACSFGESMFEIERSLSVFTDLTSPIDLFMLHRNLFSYVAMLVLAVKRRATIW